MNKNSAAEAAKFFVKPGFFFGSKNKRNAYNSSWTVFSMFLYISIQYIVHESMPFFPHQSYALLCFFLLVEILSPIFILWLRIKTPGGSPLLGWNKPNLCLRRWAVFFFWRGTLNKWGCLQPPKCKCELWVRTKWHNESDLLSLLFC